MRKHGKVIKLVNLVHEVYGVREILELPKGEKGSLTNCPLAEVLFGYAVWSGMVCLPDFKDKLAAKAARAWGTKASTPIEGFRLVELPKELIRFIDKFDAGKYPELEKTDETK